MGKTRFGLTQVATFGLRGQAEHGRIAGRRPTTLPQESRQVGEVGIVTSNGEIPRVSVTLLLKDVQDLALTGSLLGLQPLRTHTKGEPRTTPTGRKLEGRYPEAMWTYVWRIGRDQDVVEQLKAIVECVAKASSIIMQARANGVAELIVRIQGPGHIGFDIPNQIVARIGEIGLALGFEVF